MKMAQDEVHNDGYEYKKGKSRYKRSNSSMPEISERTKVDIKEREMWINDIQKQIANIDKRIAYKQRRIEMATVKRKFKTYDERSEEISQLERQHRELNYKLGPLQKNSKILVWYFQNKIAKQKAFPAVASTDLQPSRESSEPVESNSVTEDLDQSGLNDDVVCLNL